MTGDIVDVHDDLAVRGWTAIDNPITGADLDELVAQFEGIVNEVGREDLARLTSANVTGRRGGDYGYLRRVDRIESKDAFRLRLTQPDMDFTALPASLVEFMNNGKEVVYESEVAFRGILRQLDERIPGIYDMHFFDLSRTDTSVRVVVSDDDKQPSDVIAEPHKDISSLTAHLRTNRQGTFYVVQPEGQIVFPKTGGDVSALFTGAGVNTGEPGIVLPSVLHGAVNGHAQGGNTQERRAIVVAQIQPNLAVKTTPPSFEETHVDAAELEVLLGRITEAYQAVA